MHSVDRITPRLLLIPNPTMEDIRHWAAEWGFSEEQTACATLEALRGRAVIGGQVCLSLYWRLPVSQRGSTLCRQRLLQAGTSTADTQNIDDTIAALLADWDACKLSPSATIVKRRIDGKRDFGIGQDNH